MQCCVLFAQPRAGDGSRGAAWFSNQEGRLHLHMHLTGPARTFIDPLSSAMIIAVLENGAMLVLSCADERTCWETGRSGGPAVTMEFPLSVPEARSLAEHGLLEMQLRSVFRNMHFRFGDHVSRRALMENARMSLGDPPLRRLG